MTPRTLLYLRLPTALQSPRRKHSGRVKGNVVFLLILDSVGNTELLLILAAALIFFGPRRLPQLGRQIGKSLSEFRRASEDFKRTWEREVNLEDIGTGLDSAGNNSILDRATERIRVAREAATTDSTQAEPADPVITPSITAIDPSLVQPRGLSPAGEPAPGDLSDGLSDGQPDSQPNSKHDWL